MSINLELQDQTFTSRSNIYVCDNNGRNLYLLGVNALVFFYIFNFSLSLLWSLCAANTGPYFQEMINRWTYQAILNALVSVDSFFTLRFVCLSSLCLTQVCVHVFACFSHAIIFIELINCDYLGIRIPVCLSVCVCLH